MATTRLPERDLRRLRRLGIAEATVAKHLEHVCARTGVQGRAQAVAMCWDALVVAAGA